MEERQIFNEMPRPTFRWLRVNHYESQLKSIKKDGPITVTASGDLDCVGPIENKELLKKDFVGVSPESMDIVKNEFRAGYTITVEPEQKKTVTISSLMKANSPYEAIRIFVDAKEKSELELLIIIDSEGDFEGQNHLLIEVVAEKNSHVSVKKVLVCNETIQHVEHRFTSIDSAAEVEFVNVEVGGQENLYSFESDLHGDKSNLVHEFAYLGDKEQRFDISMLMTHRGKKSNSDIHSLGALTDNAVKAFRGTLDFLLGCTGSEGAEEDTCLLLNDRVKSISVPLLLCKEDDVVGNHAASAGQMDPNKLFYLMSRGFSEEEAKHVLVESMLRPVIDKLGHEQIAAKALDFIRHKI